MTSLKLNVVDQSPVHGTREPIQAPLDSIELAKLCDELGYKRYWLAEHHNSIHFAGPCPEILIARIAADTKNMRIGSGGVMLSHYSAYKVSEIFRMLETLYPGRIDLGIGRAPGGNQTASAALAGPHATEHSMQVDHFTDQAVGLCNYLRRTMGDDDAFSQLVQLPDNTPTPELWMLGSGGGSSSLAGTLGMGLAIAHFIAPAQCTPSIFQNYEAQFSKVKHEHTPFKMLAIAAVCAETEADAKLIAGTSAYRKMMAKQGQKAPLLSVQEVQDAYKKMNVGQQATFDSYLGYMTVGSPEQCWDKITNLSKEFSVNEIGVVTVTHSFEHRKESYRLLGQFL
ncbi:MAG: MsnO8 family LLM class oxidoreductase [Pseudomonadales bacterium]